MGNDLKKKIDQFRERLEGCSDLWEEASVELEFGEMLIEALDKGDLVTRSEMEAVEKRLEETQAKLYSLEKGVWRDGEPDKVSGSEWFIAETEWRARVVLRRLDDDGSYDYETAEETFVTSERAQIKRWMQFPDSHFLPPDTNVSLAALEEAVAKAVAEEREAVLATLTPEEWAKHAPWRPIEEPTRDAFLYAYIDDCGDETAGTGYHWMGDEYIINGEECSLVATHYLPHVYTPGDVHKRTAQRRARALLLATLDALIERAE